MRVLGTTYLIRAGAFGNSSEWDACHAQIRAAIAAVTWPVGSDSFTLHPARKGNGVVPIKRSCMADLKLAGWSLETRFAPGGESKPGPIDATCAVRGGLLCLEWETGNVSSSHRALNKMALGLITGDSSEAYW